MNNRLYNMNKMYTKQDGETPWTVIFKEQKATMNSH